jgi:dTDP-4-dehydrorhamnose 3,5-epimerase
MVYAPQGFAHGYQTLEDNTEMSYLTSSAYAPNSASGVRWDDPAFGIRWPLPVSMISKQDRSWPDFESTASKISKS